MNTNELNKRINFYINEIFYYIDYPKKHEVYPMWKYKDGTKKPIRELSIEEFINYHALVRQNIDHFKYDQKKDELYEESYKILMPLLEVNFKALDDGWNFIKKYIINEKNN